MVELEGELGLEWCSGTQESTDGTGSFEPDLPFEEKGVGKEGDAAVEDDTILST